MSYSGPGDLDTYYVWCGLRAYSAAVAATGTQNCVDIQNQTTTVTNTFKILTTGAVDTASIATFLGGATGIITKWYDQSGNGFDMALTSGTGATYTIGDAGLGSGQPCGDMAGSGVYANTSGEPFPSQPFSFTSVSKRTTTSGTQIILSVAAGNVQLAYNGTGGGYQYAGTVVNWSATDNAWHTLCAIYNGASGSITIDGSTTTTSAGATGGGFQAYEMSDAGSPLTGRIVEFGLKSAAVSSPSSLNTNQQYWFSAIPSSGGGNTNDRASFDTEDFNSIFARDEDRAIFDVHHVTISE